MTDPTGSYQFTYDAWGNLVQEDKTVLGVPYTIGYGYDQDKRLTSMTYPSGRVVEYIRDALGKVTEVRTNGGQVIVDNVTHLPFGPISGFSHANGIAVTRAYDQDYHLTGLTAGAVIDQTQGRNELGEITSITDKLDPGNNQAFTYDDLSRLTAATGPYGTISYTYDPVGNRLTKTDSGLPDTYSYLADTDKLQAITGANPETFIHDPNGSITSRTNTVFTYNQNNRLTRAVVGGSQTFDYLINGFGQRVIKTEGLSSTIYHYDLAGRLIAETDQTGALLKEYIYLGGELIAVADASGLFHAHSNHRGEPVKATNALGTVVWESSSKPFGTALVNEDPDGDLVSFRLNLRLPGQYYDVETGQHYNHFRFYGPDIGRYLKADPKETPSYNYRAYVYARNDPHNMEDSDRKEKSLIGKVPS